MIGNDMIYLGNFETPIKNNGILIKGIKDSRNSFEEIFEDNKRNSRYSELNCRPKDSSKNIQQKSINLYKKNIIENKLDNNHDTCGQDSHIEYSGVENKEDKSIINEENNNISFIEEKDIELSSEEILQRLSTIEELLQSLLNVNIGTNLVDSTDIAEYEMVNPVLNETLVELKNISLKLEDSYNVLIKLDQSKSLKIFQEIQAIINILENSNVDKIDSTFIKELKTSVDLIIKQFPDCTQQLTPFLHGNTNMNTDEVPLPDDDKLKESTYNENIHEDTDYVSYDVKVKTNYLVDDINASNENIDIVKIPNNPIVNQNVKLIEQNYDLPISTSNSSKDVITIDKNSIFEQITDKIKVEYKNIHDEIKIKLKPEALGEMTIKVIVEKGIVTAKAVVESYHIKQLLDSNVEQLKDSFREQGVAFQALDVSVNKDSGYDRNRSESWTNNKKTKNRKTKIDETKVSGLYEDVNIKNVNSMNVYHSGLDLIV